MNDDMIKERGGVINEDTGCARSGCDVAVKVLERMTHAQRGEEHPVDIMGHPFSRRPLAQLEGYVVCDTISTWLDRVRPRDSETYCRSTRLQHPVPVAATFHGYQQ